MDKFSKWTKFSHVEIEFIRLKICTIYTTISNASLKHSLLSQFKHSLSVKHSFEVQTLSLKHRNQSSSTSRHATKITLTLKHSPLSSQSASDDPLTHTMKIPFVPTNGSSDFFKFEGMFFL